MKRIVFFIAVGVVMIQISACKKEKDDDNQISLKVPVLSTYGVNDITFHSAKGGGNITSDNGSTVTVRGVCWSTNQLPTIADSKTNEGNGAGGFTSLMSGLTPNTTYYARAYATNEHGTGYGFPVKYTTLESNSFLDIRDGNIYRYVTIGTQDWIIENMRYLPSVSVPDTLSSLHPFYYVYNYYGTDVNTARLSENYPDYGVLYNWKAAMTACPAGWRLPGETEWSQLISFLGYPGIAGGKLKETGTSHWNSPNTGATNESGFTALPGGMVYINMFYAIRASGVWWSSTQQSSIEADVRILAWDDEGVTHNFMSKSLGASVRCVKDTINK
jgi:uncharacterized protein (TIGR02145 family)